MYTIGAAGITSGENRILYIGIAIVLGLTVMGIGGILKKRYLAEEETEEEHEK